MTGPLAWLGILGARALELPALHGLIVGTLAAGALSSTAFYLWLRSVLRNFSREC